MVQNVGIRAAGVFEGVGEDGQAVEGPLPAVSSLVRGCLHA
jgi:hypothetical protein